MKVSVVVCTYSMERYDVFSECVESVLGQTYDPIEVVIVVDGNDEVFDRVSADFGEEPETVLHNNETNEGISYSRTKGAEIATGEIVAFIDDDAIAEPDWIEQLVAVYDRTDAVAVGGHVRPDWVSEEPSFFPEEFYWLIGCDERDFAEHLEEVRNTYGSNISYRREVFLAVGGYDPKTGRRGDRHIQAHEAPVGVRIMREYGQGMVYTTAAVVNHRMFDYRGDFVWLVKRAFMQGYSKRIFNVLYPDAPSDEQAYLWNLLFVWIPSRLASLLRGPSVPKLLQLVSIVVFTAAVGAGYLYGFSQSKSELTAANTEPSRDRGS